MLEVVKATSDVCGTILAQVELLELIGSQVVSTPKTAQVMQLVEDCGYGDLWYKGFVLEIA